MLPLLDSFELTHVPMKQTALHIACRAGLAGAAQALLDQPGLDVDAPEARTGKTPLMLALCSDNPQPLVRRTLLVVVTSM
jgi:hypothetical protein